MPQGAKRARPPRVPSQGRTAEAASAPAARPRHPRLNLEQLHALVAPVVVAEGLELVHLELQGSGGGRVLRVYMDKPPRPEQPAEVGLEGVGLADCERVSRQLSLLLDAAEAVTGTAYLLEVSSPGLDRPLVKPADFERFRGQRVQVQTRVPVQERRRFVGVLVGFEAGEAILAVEAGQRVAIAWENIDKARLAPLWPAPGKPSGR